jgi:hypothetical protein
MEQERQVGHIVSVDSLTVYVKLEDNIIEMLIAERIANSKQY